MTDTKRKTMDPYMTKPINPKNGDRYRTKDGVWYIFRNGSWKKSK